MRRNRNSQNLYYRDEPPSVSAQSRKAIPPPTPAWSLRNGRREGKDRLGIRCAQFKEAEAQPGGR